jgi:hypothetical protein
MHERTHLIEFNRHDSIIQWKYLIIFRAICFCFFLLKVRVCYIENIIWLFPYHIPYQPETTPISSREPWYRVIRVLPRWQISLWHFRCLRMGKMDVITFKYVINYKLNMIWLFPYHIQASREPHDVTSPQLLIVVWKMSTFSEDRFVGVSEAESSTDIDHSYP